MASDYASIRADNERRYGTDIGRIGPMLLADRYDDRTHFIFELLQNAEDAIARRSGWQGSRAVTFHLDDASLRVSHFGEPFDGRDVRGICGIAEGTKDLTAIGRFGIGFKSVYAFTNRPEIHSGAEDFAVENFVWPTAAPPLARDRDETLIVLPLKMVGSDDFRAIAAGFQRLGPRTLLFLRQIDEIGWAVAGGPSGRYLRGEPEMIGEYVRRVRIIGQQPGGSDREETWLVFSREARTSAGQTAGYVEIAFCVADIDTSGRWSIQPVAESPLVVFFPTVLPTNLGFLVQGPYRTTPSRDNVPLNDPWNEQLVQGTASLLVEALRWLRDHDMLDTEALRCLPLDRGKFAEGTRFAPLFDGVRQALTSEPLLPRYGGSYVSAGNAKLARTQELRELFDSHLLGALLGGGKELFWLSGDITSDRTPELRQYLLGELAVAEVTPEAVLSKLDARFLAAQSDDWIRRLYEFLNGRPALRRHVKDLPLIRLSSGKHVVAQIGGQPQAFLPSGIETGFPAVRPEVCATEAAREFLRALGLTEPDPVDDVVWNVLPKYRASDFVFKAADYETDIRRILAAFASDSTSQREKLLRVLRETAFVRAVDAGCGERRAARPGELYMATERLKELFSGVTDVMLVDDECSCLRGEDARNLLEACGAVRHLRPVPDASFSWQERKNLREQAGHAETSGQNDRVTDWTLCGMERMLEALLRMSVAERTTKAKLLWEELAHLEERRGKGVFAGEYTWTHYGSYRSVFDAAFVRKLNKSAWVPDENGELQRPESILFDSLNWKPNPFLQSKIQFKTPAIAMLAREAGIEVGALDLLKKLGVTSEAELRRKLGIEGESTDGEESNPQGPFKRPSSTRTATGGEVSESGKRGDRTAPSTHDGAEVSPSTSRSKDPLPFISYLGTHPDDDQPDPDGLEHQARMDLEEKAIRQILAQEPNLCRTPRQNPGFDLFMSDGEGHPVRWIEVKAMTGSLHDRPVGLSRAQFACAQNRGQAYWLYIVEHAGDAVAARIVRIQDPAGRARTFTFDRGWLGVARLDGPPD